jgi:hypothetical protein
MGGQKIKLNKKDFKDISLSTKSVNYSTQLKQNPLIFTDRSIMASISSP